jgi:hypothetical protein
MHCRGDGPKRSARQAAAGGFALGFIGPVAEGSWGWLVALGV